MRPKRTGVQCGDRGAGGPGFESARGVQGGAGAGGEGQVPEKRAPIERSSGARIGGFGGVLGGGWGRHGRRIWGWAGNRIGKGREAAGFGSGHRRDCFSARAGAWPGGTGPYQPIVPAVACTDDVERGDVGAAGEAVQGIRGEGGVEDLGEVGVRGSGGDGRVADRTRPAQGDARGWRGRGSGGRRRAVGGKGSMDGGRPGEGRGGEGVHDGQWAWLHGTGGGPTSGANTATVMRASTGSGISPSGFSRCTSLPPGRAVSATPRQGSRQTPAKARTPCAGRRPSSPEG